MLVPILASTTSAWWFQLQAMRATGLTILLAGTVATALESLGLAFAALTRKAKAANDSAALYRAGMWAVVAIAAAVNYRHGSNSWSQPGLTGVVFASLPVGSVTGWELREPQAHREHIADRLPARRPRFRYARWIRYPRPTYRALSVAIRDGYTDTTTALSVAEAERAAKRSLAEARQSFGRVGRKLFKQRIAAAECGRADRANTASPATDTAGARRRRARGPVRGRSPGPAAETPENLDAADPSRRSNPAGTPATATKPSRQALTPTADIPDAAPSTSTTCCLSPVPWQPNSAHDSPATPSSSASSDKHCPLASRDLRPHRVVAPQEQAQRLAQCREVKRTV